MTQCSTSNPQLTQLLEKIRKTFDVSFEPLDVDGARIETLTINNMQAHLDRLIKTNAVRNPLRDLPLWAKVWPSSFVLGRFLRRYEPAGKTLLDIGCGTGVCGLVAAQYGYSRILLGDVANDALDFARANVLRNCLEDRISVRHLDVADRSKNGEFDERFDVIAASEILYLDELHRPLLKFVSRHLKPGGKAVFCTDLARLKPRFKKLASEKFRLEEGNLRVKNMTEEGVEEKRVYNILVLEDK